VVLRLAMLRVLSWVFAIETYGAAGDAVKALLALDGHVGAVRSLELDIKGGCMGVSACRVLVHLSSLFHPNMVNPGRCGRSPC
jgi:hypothetical protein